LKGIVHTELAYSHSTRKCMGNLVSPVSIWPASPAR
jgi:hypothetical protein